MSTRDRIAAHQLQLEGLKSWPDGPEKDLMTKWVLRKIASLYKELQ